MSFQDVEDASFSYSGHIATKPENSNENRIESSKAAGYDEKRSHQTNTISFRCKTQKNYYDTVL